MKEQTNPRAKKTEPANPFLNAAITAAVALTILPAVLFGAARILHSKADLSAKGAEVEQTAPKRSSIAERRAQRLEARKAKEAKEAKVYPEITLETVEPYYYDDFGMDYDADMDFDGFDMMSVPYMGGPGMMPAPYMGGPGMMPAPYMGGPGMMPAPYRESFNEFGRMPGAGGRFNNGFGRGRGNF